MPTAAIKHFWMAGKFAAAIQKILVAVANIRPRLVVASSAVKPHFAISFSRIRERLASTFARIRGDNPKD